MSTQAQISANKLNCLRSTGPRSRAGRLKSSMNALKHGMRSAKVEQFRETSYMYEERRVKWMGLFDARNDVEEFMASQNAALSLNIERVQRADAAEYASLVERADADAIERVYDLGSELYFDPCGPIALYGRNRGTSKPKNVTTSWSGRAGDPPRSPDKIVRELLSSAIGCRFLLQEWGALLEHLEREGGFWVASDRLKTVRLLGRQPVDAIDDRRVADLFAACHAIHPSGEAFDELLSDMGQSDLEDYLKELKARYPDLVGADDSEKARQILLELVDQEVVQIEAILEEHEENANTNDSRVVDRLGFDKAPTARACDSTS